MGYLKTAGAPLTFVELQKIKAYIKKHGILQFINLYKTFATRNIPSEISYKWGDETEHHVVYLDEERKEAKLLANAGDFKDLFNETKAQTGIALQPEYGAWMLEAIPTAPFNSLNLSNIANLDAFFRTRRVAISKYISSFGNFILSNIPSYPLLGTGNYAVRIPKLTEEIELARTIALGKPIHPPIEEPKPDPKIMRKDSDVPKEEVKKEEDHMPLPLSTEYNKYSNSLFTFDGAINAHPRFPTLSKMIRERRGEKVCIKVPLFMDYKTVVHKNPTITEPFPGYIYMDSMAFGMGCCCLQLTYQCQNIDHARYLHDQLLALVPIMSALSASAPIYRGRLSDIDLRFTVISQSVDDRTPEERNPESPHYINKPRYSHNSHYISSHDSVMPHHNNSIKLEVNPEHIAMLKDAGIDDRLAYHIASLFVRDPLVVFEKAIELDDKTSNAHFENLQSTNWNSMRFKPPPSFESNIGWRVEFRPMDLQLTDYENGALTAVISLIVRLISERNVNFIIPILLGDENMERAHHRNAILSEKFYFRKNIIGQNYKVNELKKTHFKSNSTIYPAEKEQLTEMTIAEILGGKPEIGYHGIFPLLLELINEDKKSTELEKELTKGYLQFLLARAKGIYRTGAQYIRDYVRNHPKYEYDSIINEKINYDLLKHLDGISGKDPREIYLAVPKAEEIDVPRMVEMPICPIDAPPIEQELVEEY